MRAEQFVNSPLVSRGVHNNPAVGPRLAAMTSRRITPRPRETLRQIPRSQAPKELQVEPGLLRNPHRVRNQEATRAKAKSKLESGMS